MYKNEYFSVSQATLLEAPPCHAASSSGAMLACKIPLTVQGSADLSLLDESSHVTMVAGVIAAGASPLPAEPLSPVHHTSDAAVVDPELLSGDGLEALPSSHMTDMSA
jgi:hypothetical protein